MFSAHQNILIPNLSCFFHQINPQIFKSLDYLKMGGQYHSLSLSLHCHLQVWRHEGSVSWPNRALRHEMDWPHRAPDQDLSHMCDVDTRLSCNTGPTSRRKVGLDFLSTTELNNSVEDYNSSRVGVVCPSPILNMGLLTSIFFFTFGGFHLKRNTKCPAHV